MADRTGDETVPGIPIPTLQPESDDGGGVGGAAQKYMSDTARAQQKVPPKSASIYDLTQQAVSSIQLEDFKKAPLIPCFRESMLTSIGAGFAFGGIRLVMRGMLSPRYLYCARHMTLFLHTDIFVICLFDVT